MHQSIATIDSPEFINLQPLELNPLMSKCEIKVLYVGENRNRSFITKEVATEMSKTLRGAPIVGYFKDSKGDFADHGQKITVDDEGIHFECLTKPYGFVSPDAQVWFQKFEDLDDFGNSVEREYLMTTGYLWTGQFEECADVVTTGRPHSMELDDKTVNGQWSTNVKSGMEFFIINDAIFSKLCILGDDVEPCFQGSSVTAPEVSKNFSLDNDFKKTLYTMMQDLKNIVSKGDQQMDNLENSIVVEENVDETVAVTATPVSEGEQNTFSTTEELDNIDASTALFAAALLGVAISEEKNSDNTNESVTTENQNSTEETPVLIQEGLEAASAFEKKDDEEEKKDEEKNEQDEEDEYKKMKNKCTLLEAENAELQEKFSALEAKYDELVAFKASIEDAKKDELIQSFTLLSDEEKKEIVENKSKYSYDEIDAKLSIMFAHKQLDVTPVKGQNTSNKEVIATFNLNNSNIDNLPDWLKAVKVTEETMN